MAGLFQPCPKEIPIKLVLAQSFPEPGLVCV